MARRVQLPASTSQSHALQAGQYVHGFGRVSPSSKKQTVHTFSRAGTLLSASVQCVGQAAGDLLRCRLEFHLVFDLRLPRKFSEG